MTPGLPIAEVTRRDVTSGAEHVESVHTGHVAVVGADGEVVAALGDPDVDLFVRSTVKPLQATSCLELLAGAGPQLSDAEVAVGWSSHRGEPEQLEAVARLLGRSGTDPERLTCPTAPPAADRSSPPRRITHNCSGKHALLALAGRRLGLAGAELLDPHGTLQGTVLADLRAELGSLSAVGVDGCGAPAVEAPLAGLARAFCRLAVDERYGQVRRAGLAHPQLVGGTGRLESALLAAGVVAKPGAEGAFCAGWTASDGSPRGLAARAADGASRGVTVAVFAVLVAAGVVPSDLWRPPPPLGGDKPAGSVRAPREVHRLGEELATAP